ncbi:MAG: NPCBM/NEW2 domain-containing protein [Planctomycetaceae bacterium]|nr:NPCBM/NEW2 domain-containing protein [Planctomycetaceae bacterium]
MTSTLTSCLLATALLTADPATVQTLDGKQLTGQLTQFGNGQIVVTGTDGPKTIPLNTVLDITFPGEAREANGTDVISLSDGSQLQGAFVMSGDTATITGAAGATEPLRVARTSIRGIRFAKLDSKVADAWTELIGRQPKEDLLIIRKGDVLDFLAGAIGDIGDQQVAVLASGRDLQAPREKLFGILFADRPSPSGSTLATATLTTGEQLTARQLSLTDDSWAAETPSGLKLTLPTGLVSRLDFGGGRIQLLSAVNFNSDDSTSPDALFPVVWFVSKDAPAGFGPQGKPLKIGKQEYQRGVWMCSNAVVRYRLNREFVRLQATAGFELTHVERMPSYNPQVEFVVEGDGRELFRRSFQWNDEPVPLDLDLTDVRELVFKVVSQSKQPGVLEFFALGDARLLK